ncbi:MAG: arsinothricin resistance N-acetyltransferase ArsN1 family B [Pseudomonadales bacterium]
MIRTVIAEDASNLCAIYNHYIQNTTVTFEEESVTAATMEQRIAEVSVQHPWLVCDLEGELAGYAYASPWKSRCAYRFSVETTVYLSPNHFGEGIGTGLYESLIEDLKLTDMHSLIAGIALPNEASIALHEKLGFEKIGQFNEVGRKFDQWIDVGYWELIFNDL